MTYEIDQTGIELIASFEGWVDGVYDDVRGFCTGFYGHLFHQSRATQQDHQTYDGKGRAYGLRLLHSDIERVCMKPMRATIKVALNQNRVNALASATFNCGPGFLYGTVGRLVNEKHWQAAADAFDLWSHPTILRPRRQHEAELFMRPAKRKVALPWLEPDERRWCLEYDRSHGDLPRRRVLRRTMHERAVEIAYAAHHEGGWELHHRRQRWHSLTARSS